MLKLFKRFLPAVLLIVCCAVCALSACNSNSDYTDEFTKLQQQIDNLKSENSSLKNQISSITPSDKDYAQEIADLKQQIENLKNSSTAEPKIYKIGETFTYSYQGVDFFSLKLDIYPESNWLRLTIKNLSAYSIVMNSCATVKFVTNNGSEINTPLTNQEINANAEYTYPLIESFNFMVKLIIGFPLANNGILPYAIFDLTTSI